MAKKTDPKHEKVSYEQLGHMLQNIYESGYIDHNRTYKMSFLKGVAAGFGGVIGATVVVAILVWLLSLFVDAPLIGPILERLQDTVQTPSSDKNP